MTERRKKPWEKPGSVGGPFLLWPDDTAVQFQLLQSQIGTLITNPKEMRNHAKDFYTDVVNARDCDINCMDDLLRNLPKLTDDQRQWLDADIQLDEISEAVKKLSNGRSPGIDGLPSEFYKQFWTLLKEDILEVFRISHRKNELPTSCRRAVLSLLPKKGDLGLLKNWRPVALG